MDEHQGSAPCIPVWKTGVWRSTLMPEENAIPCWSRTSLLLTARMTLAGHLNDGRQDSTLVVSPALKRLVLSLIFPATLLSVSAASNLTEKFPEAKTSATFIEQF